MIDLDGGTAVITGAARGLGAGLARAAARRGMRLVLADIDAEPLSELAEAFGRQGVEAMAVPTDVSDPQALERLALRVADAFGDVRLLINNAGIEMVAEAWQLSARDWQRIVGVNVLGPILGTRAFAPAMIASGKPALILNIASLGALGMMGLQTPYILTKHAILSFSEGLFLEMKSAAPMIHVAVALPGPVATGIFDSAALRVGDGAAAQVHLALKDMLARDGMSPDQAAALVLDAAVAGEFWVTTHPGMLDAVARDRAHYMVSARRPDAMSQ